MLGIPFVIGNFLPVSGHTRKPSFTSTYTSTAANLHCQTRQHQSM